MGSAPWEVKGSARTASHGGTSIIDGLFGGGWWIEDNDDAWLLVPINEHDGY